MRGGERKGEGGGGRERGREKGGGEREGGGKRGREKGGGEREEGGGRERERGRGRGRGRGVRFRQSKLGHLVPERLSSHVPDAVPPGQRLDHRLRWQGSPALGRSFVDGLELDDGGQLRVRRGGVYRLHIQVTLANCSSSTRAARPPRATLTVGICSPAAHSISLLRPFLGFSWCTPDCCAPWPRFVGRVCFLSLSLFFFFSCLL
uniref:THD domain-containing protein n=1 Tax=Lynx canadensis TaxID=61383 RepID=A0A667HBB9_LYNCA